MDSNKAVEISKKSDLEVLREELLADSGKDSRFSASLLDPIKKVVSAKSDNKAALKEILLEKDSEGRDLLKFFIHSIIMKHQRVAKMRDGAECHDKKYSLGGVQSNKSDNVCEAVETFLNLVEREVNDRKVMESIINDKDNEGRTLANLLLTEFPEAIENLIRFVVSKKYLTKENIPDLLPIAVASCYSRHLQPLAILLPEVTNFIRNGEISAGEIAYLQDKIHIHNGKIINKEGAEIRANYDIDVVKGIGEILADKKPVTVPRRLSVTPLEDGLKESAREFIDQVREKFKSDFFKEMPRDKREVLSGVIIPVSQGNLQGQKSTTCTIL